MISKIGRESFEQMPWKNGKGTTTQILIEPTGASIAAGNFIYRFSSAPVEEDGEFSAFPKMQRILLPIAGAGMVLNEKVYKNFEVAEFSGDEKMFCRLVDGPVLDFGIIYDPTKINVKTTVVESSQSHKIMLNEKSDNFIVLLRGDLFISGGLLHQLECLKLSEEKEYMIRSVTASVVLCISITPTTLT